MIQKEKSINTRKLTVAALLSALVVVMSFTPLGFLPTPGLNITLLHIPTIIAAMIEGPVIGMIVGLVFGISSITEAVLMPNPFSFVFYNPLISVLPRVLIGLITYYVYSFVKKVTKNNTISYITGAIAGTITNTTGVLGMIYILYAEKYLNQMNMVGNNPNGLTIEKILMGIVATNMLPEIIVASIFSLAICKALSKMLKR